MVHPVAPLGIADEGDDFLALGQAGCEVVKQVRVVVEAQFIQLNIAEVLHDELSEFSLVYHI